MKPTRNKYYCMACGRTKMLFEDEAHAMNFIRFNSDDVARENGHAPVRAYYCHLCMGWHLTSNPNVEFVDSYPR